jgi:pimeloyl-ACP methyl ester carboxylesterase
MVGREIAPRARAWAALAVVLAVVVAACGSSGGGVAAPRGMRTVTFAGPHGSELSGRELGRGDVAVVLAHGASTDQSSWYGAMPGLARAGYRVLAFDARGVGDSTGTSSLDPAARAADIEAAVRFARRQGARRVVVMGSSLGAIATLRAARSEDFAAVVGVSPPEQPGDLAAVTAPALFVASRGDTYPAAAARTLGEHFGRPAVIVSGSVHGADLFADHPEAVDAVVEFLGAVAPAR